MALTARMVDVPARPLDLAARIADRPGAFLLFGGSGGGRSFIGCDPIESSGALCPSLDSEPGAGELGRAPRWVGVVPYECRRGLERPRFSRAETRAEPQLIDPIWFRYPAVAEIGERVRVIGDDPAAVAALAERLRRPKPLAEATLELTEPPEAPERHRERIRQVLELIAKGELYQVNIARRFRLRARGGAIALLARLARRAPAPYSAALTLGEVSVAATSPELLLALEPDGRVTTSPIKGTRPRGVDAEHDGALAAELDADPKERAELSMILDVERNDLGRIATVGSVRLLAAPRVVTHRTIHHRVATLGARLAPGVDREALLRAMLPSGSVTGAPKIRAMEVIAETEPERRGLYTGGFGMLRHDGGLVLGMAIRTLTIRDGEGHYFSGGGIVADSDPEREVAETHWKALQLFS